MSQPAGFWNLSTESGCIQSQRLLVSILKIHTQNSQLKIEDSMSPFIYSLKQKLTNIGGLRNFKVAMTRRMTDEPSAQKKSVTKFWEMKTERSFKSLQRKKR